MRSKVDKKVLDIVDYYMILTADGYIKEIYSKVESEGNADINAFAGSSGDFGESENRQFHAILGV